ncbi:Glucanosyltransferase-domain-containing protein [Coniochaeta sp. 2T2.1]|nr:Glucanosyltransferase-domain-containing protein [Coniochaeta sp. 2T2.1]
MFKHAALLALSASLAAAVQPLEAIGNFFVNPKDQTRFQIVGVDYQPGGSAGFDGHSDPLSDAATCLRDAAIMQVLGVNTVRIYNINPDLNHDECVSIFNAAGMYLVIDVNTPIVAQHLTSYKVYESYYSQYSNHTFAMVEAFKDYPNTLAFFSGNEIIDTIETAASVPPYIRAVTRDLKTYISKHCDRQIPVGYSAADVRDVLMDTFNYLQCSDPEDSGDMSRSDIFALNSYSWCGAATFTSSGYDGVVRNFTGASVPVFFSEYGCNTPAPRIFTEVPAIYGSEFTSVMSGGMVYQYTQEENDFGLVTLHDNGTAELLDDFYTLRDQYAKLDFKSVESVKASTGSPPTPPKCDPKLIVAKGFNANFTLPVMPPGTEDIIKNGVSPAPKGKLVSLSDLKVKQQVIGNDGKAITGLAVKALPSDQSNSPGSNTVSGGSSTTSPSGTPTGSSPSSSPSKDAAPRTSGSFAAVFGLLASMAYFALQVRFA